MMNSLTDTEPDNIPVLDEPDNIPVDGHAHPGAPDPTTVLVGLVRSMEGNYVRVVRTNGDVHVGRIMANRKNEPDTRIRLSDISGAQHVFDLSDVTDIMWTSHVPF